MGHLLWDEVEEAHGFFDEVAAVGAVPFIVLLDEHVSCQPQQRGGVGEGADDVGAALRVPTGRILPLGSGARIRGIFSFLRQVVYDGSSFQGA